MEPNNDPPPPFWSPPSTTRRRHSSSPPFISLPVLIILLPTLALILLFFIIRPFLSLTSQFFKPSSVKKSWDSFNVFLVLFAVICGIFARRNDDGPTVAEVEETRVSDVRTVDDSGVKENREAGFSQQWFGFSERRISDPLRRTPATGMTRLRRNSSYPDLRQESLWEIDNERPQFRFFDDFEIQKYRFKEESPEIKVVPVDSFMANYSSPAPERLKSPTPTPTPPPPPPLPRKPRRTYQSVKKNSEIEKTQTPPPPPPPPPRQVIPPSPIRIKLEEKFGKKERKKTNVKKEIAMALASLYKQKKKRNKQKIEPQPPSPSPPSPPPPPPPSVFRGLFKKSNKNKRVHSESPLPPSIPDSLKKMNQTQIPSPPPPPPKSSGRRNSTTNSRPRPPLPTRVHNSYVENENINSGGQSPLITIPPAPPPPPPPPFKMTELKSGAEGRGGFVGSKSPESSRSESPEPENVDPPSIKDTAETVGGVGQVFCPSPDVNVKAAKFIARLRDGWKLEKMNSVREKERLGQSPTYQTQMGQGPNVQD